MHTGRGGGSDIYNVHLSISTTQAYKINSQPMMFEFFNKMKSFTENAKTPDLMGGKKNKHRKNNSIADSHIKIFATYTTRLLE